MADPTQDTHQFRLTTPLGKDVLLCQRWTCTEAASTFFDLRIECLSRRADIRPGELLLKQVTLLCALQGQPVRHFTGIVRQVERAAAAAAPTLFGYVLHVVPPAWVLDQGTGYEVFADIDIPQLLEKVIGPLKHSVTLRRSHDVAPSMTRYDETRWAFLSRMMEREGIFHTFRHTATECELLLNDREAIALHGVDKLSDIPADGTPELTVGGISQQPTVRRVVVATSNVALVDQENMEETITQDIPPSPAVWELKPSQFTPGFESGVYDVVTGAQHDGVARDNSADAAALTKVSAKVRSQSNLLAQEGLAATSRLTGTSTAAGLTAAAKVDLKVSTDPTLTGTYFIVSVTHTGENGSFIAADNSSPRYINSFAAQMNFTPFRPARSTKWPSVQGVHLGTVVGPANEEIFTDKFGRIRVAFEWTKLSDPATRGPTDGCWVRVAQPVAGAQWGAFFLPRVGHQVLVSFLNGDPDAPIVVGSLYNNVNTPLQTLPRDQAHTGIRTRSTPQGTAETFNELRFDDKKGAEQVHFKAQSNLDALINNNVTIDIGEGKQIVRHRKGDRELHHAEGDEVHEVLNGKRTTTIAPGDDLTTVDGGSWLTDVKQGDVGLRAKQIVQVRSTDESVVVKASKQIKLETETNAILLLASSDVNITANSGKVLIEAATEITLKVGSNLITISTSGIDITAAKIAVTASTAADITAGAKLSLTGAMVMIN